MNFVLLVTLLCGVVSIQALTDEQKAKIKQHSQACIAESGVDPELVKKGQQGDFADDPKLFSYIFCFLKKTEIMNDAAEIQPDVVKQKLAADATEAEINNVLSKCKDFKGVPAEIAAKFWKCYWVNSSKHIALS